VKQWHSTDEVVGYCEILTTPEPSELSDSLANEDEHKKIGPKPD